MIQQESEMGEMVDTPIGRKSILLIVAALEQYYNPFTTIALLWGIDDVKSRRESLTDEQAMDVLNECKDNHDAEQGMSWGTIDFWIGELFGDEDV
jgi:hypothetical protein